MIGLEVAVTQEKRGNAWCVTPCFLMVELIRIELTTS